MRARFRIPSTIAALACLAALPARAQEGPITFEFSFSNPGARSMSLGGAFAALADDATAAFANPGGLVQLLEPELTVEARSWSYDTPFVAGGRVSGVPSGIGLDTLPDLRYGVSSNDLTGLSFLSFVYPGRRWSIGVYRQQWANFSLTRQIDSFFGEIDGEIARAEDVVSQMDFDVVNNGVVGSFELTDSLSVGLGMVVFQAEMSAESREYGVDDEGLFEPNPLRADLLDTTYSLGGSDTGIAFHTGLLWHPSEQWSMGAYFRRGPRVSLQLKEVVGPANDAAPEGTIEADETTDLSLPSIYGVGLAYTDPEGALTMSFEWDRVLYSSITNGLDDEVFDRDSVRLSDGDEIHVGLEYVFQSVKPVFALRTGVWRDPAHRLGAGPSADRFERAIFDGGENEYHFAFGGGLVISRVQLDVGADLSKTSDLLSFSVVYRF